LINEEIGDFLSVMNRHGSSKPSPQASPHSSPAMTSSRTSGQCSPVIPPCLPPLSVLDVASNDVNKTAILSNYPPKYL
jgi:hypothetical protein